MRTTVRTTLRKLRDVKHAKCRDESYLVDALGQLEEIAEEAFVQGSYQAAVRAKTTALEVRERLEEHRALKAAATLPAYDEHLDELLVDTRKRRMSAKGQAVAALLKLEAELVEQRRAREEALEAARLAHLSEPELVAFIGEALVSLPHKIVGDLIVSTLVALPIRSARSIVKRASKALQAA